MGSLTARTLALLALAAIPLAARAQTVAGDCEEPGVVAGAAETLVRGVRSLLRLPPEPPRVRAGLTDCPPGTGFRPLSSVHPAREVFVGTYPDPRFAEYAKSLADAVGRVAPGVPVNLLVHPRGALPGGTGDPSLFDFARTPAYASRVRTLEVTGDPRGGQWAQDGFEGGVTGPDARPAAVDFYRGAASLAASRSGASDAPLDAGGGQGGDVEAFPGGVVVTGSRTTPAMRRLLREGSGEAPLEIDTSWLRVGHVDELFGVVPTGEGACDFAIVHASPAAALELVDRLPPDARLEPLGPAALVEEHGMRRPSGTGQCLESLPANSWGSAPLSAGAARACPAFAALNRDYEARIQESLGRIRSAIAAKTGCAAPATIAVPQLFRPGGIGGARAGAEAVNPNAVNSLVLGRAIIAGEQPNDLFRDEIRRRFLDRGVRVEYVDARMFHFNGGTVHCSTNAIRTCR